MEAVKEKVQLPKYSSYKNSGADWLGEIPELWKVIRMKFLYYDYSRKNRKDAELLSVTQDKGVVPRNWVENRMVMPSGNLESFKFIEKSDFAISLRSFEGGLEYCHHDGIISPAYTVLKERRNDLRSEYYKYLFKSHSFISELQTSVVGIREGKNISFNELSYSLMPIPPKQEQTAIANYLDKKCGKIESAIAQKQKLIELLKERKQIIIQNAVTKGLDPNVKMKDSGVEWIGDIPENWEVKRLKEITQAFGRIGFRGYTTSDLVGEGEGAITISPSNILRDHMLFESNSFLSWQKYNESPEIQIKDQDILIVKTGSTYGKIGFVQNLPIEATINPQLLVLKNIKINNEFLFHLLRSTVIQIQIQKEVIGSTIPTISEKKILNMKVAVPKPSEQERILKVIQKNSKKYNEAVSLQEQQIKKLKEYKNSLIDAVVTGKIKVS